MMFAQLRSRMCGLVSRAGPILLSCSLCFPLYAQVSFPVSFSDAAAGLTQDERDQLTSHYQAAGRKWAQMLGITELRNIEILIGVEDIPTVSANSATSVFFGTFDNRATYEQGAAHELRTGTDANGSSADVLVNIGLDYLRNELWFDPDPDSRSAPVPVDKTDAMSSALHEIGHALAYNGWADGMGIPPADFWSTFDRWMQGSSPTLFHGPAAIIAWGSAPELTTNNINHWGNLPGLQVEGPKSHEAVQWQDGVPVPRDSCPGMISIDPPANLAELLATDTLLDELMNGVAFVRGTRYFISPLDMATLQDAGLPFDPEYIFHNGFEH